MLDRNRLYIAIAIVIVAIFLMYFYTRTVTVSEYKSANVSCTAGNISTKSALWAGGSGGSDVTDKIKTLCDGKGVCYITANTTALGDPAPGRDKTLTMQYNCGKLF